ncbi:60S ribosomal protein L37 [Elasticomyces elasticus]|uniref:60S ribosomal protein L37 n=1 Tax=Exophiala sideris TaxID=1016849 RepID=A0ABR0J3X3_9EURO|nr:60S ribosomal protein L37 [Elasticomyces elasticus]KAK5026430.1 60S ribosomal protein L37 [Exophiala sideris]KAK5033829.1 60S ribosomal protein L37 [Exophiala sideris]KAK5055651.1 60S ribosomal protein L37 [Exophiala sideris]KAK5179964.1 60S ribosomal protein L37 [Eurotiomycetes sp. CCFEE 6388]
MANLTFLHVFLAFVALFSLANADCNPLVNASCPAVPGLATNTYSVDFTQQKATPSDWIQAEGETVTYDSQNGATFTFAKRYDAPYIWSRFYFLFGHVEVVVKTAPGTGIITAATLLSDDLDEVDWEWSGNDFDQPSGLVQTNYFGKGVTGNYDRSTTVTVSDPQAEFHTYAWDWTPNALTWSIDGTNVRTLTNNYQTTGDYQYPQTPSRVHLGVWDAGDPDNSPTTVYWGGGTTNFSLPPFSGYVKSVKITTSTPCSSWKYPNSFNGTYEDVLCTNQTITLPCTYTVAAGNNGQTIADSLGVTLDALKAANPNVNWDLLIVGQTLKVPGGSCPISTTSTTMSTTSTTISTTSTTLSTTSTTLSTTPTTRSTTSTTRSTTSPSFNFANTSTTTSMTSYTTSSMISSNTSTVVATTTVTSSINLTSASSAAPSSSLSETAAATTIPSASPTAALSTSNADSSTSIAPTATAAETTAATSTQSAAYSLYTVVAGDCGYEIASKLGCSFDALSAVNPGVDWDMLMPGQTLNIPCPLTGSGTSNTGATVVAQPSATASTSGTGSISASGTSAISSSGPDQQSSAPAVTAGGASSNPASAAATTLPDSPSAMATQISTSADVAAQPTAVSTSFSNPTGPSSTSCATLSSSSQATATSTPYWSNSTVASQSVASNSTSLLVLNSTAPTAQATSDVAAAATTVLPDNDDTTAAPTSQSTTTLSGTTVTSTSSLLASSTTVSNMVSPTTPATLAKMVCNEDNCLRNMIDTRYSSAMLSFCPSYTTITSDPAPLPTFLGNCVGNTSRVSSACSCLMTSYAPTIHASSETPAMTAAAMQGGTGRSLRLRRTPLRFERAQL